ncbi:hypothetical protein [Photobacterium atrarenae]|uniref:Uncharacterized protein n=1 Tax=Photobacterium atrarenae TaxID=865757 RepID=A0ABY5GI94_9GAMM|nr:hypothetical protein [Photobacterium atrarenae]UTV29002.1 hypothetical protein NNL38_07165 [Photobacterium atrarenae]
MSAQIADFNIRFNSESAQFNKDVDYAKKMLRGYTKEAKAANHSTGGFNKQVNVAGVSLKGLGKTAKTTARAFGGVTAGFGAVTTASTYMIRQTAQQAREIERMATVAQVSAGEIQALGYASEQYNIAGDKMADILKDVNDKIGDFDENEGGEFADFMENIAPLTGLTIEQLQRLSGPEALIAVKEAMDAANLPMKSQLHYLEAIANDASALMPLLENKGAKLYELTQRYDDLNVAMSEYDIEQMKQMDQQLNDMSLKMQASFRQAVIGSKDQIDWLTEHVSYSVSWWGTLFDSMSDNPRTEQGMVKRLGELRGDLKETKAEAEAAKSELKKLEEISGRAEGDAALTARLANAGHPEKLAKTRARFDVLKHDADELQAKIDRAQKAYNVAVLGMNYDQNKPSDTPPGINGGGDGDKPRLSQSEQDELDRKQKAGQARLETLDNQYANERDKLQLAHQQRLSDIDTLQLSEQELTRRGFETMSALKSEYKDRERAHHAAEVKEYQRQQDEALQRELGAFTRTQQEKTRVDEAEKKKRAYMDERLNQERIRGVSNFMGQVSQLRESENKNAARIGKTAARFQIMLNAYESATSAYNALVGIPYVGPGLAAAAAGTAMGFGLSMASKVDSINMAHNGIGEVPMMGGRRESNWTLMAGERVYTNDSARQIDQMYQAVMAMSRQRFAVNDPTQAFARQAAAMPRGGGVILNMYGIPQDARIEEKETDNGQTQVDVFLSDLDSDGQMSQAITRTFGIPRVGAA